MTRTSLLTSPDPRNGAGFSLIELLVVVAVITLISVFALPAISSYFQISLNSASREIASIVKEAYNSAVISGKVNRIVYDLKNGQYWVESGPPTILLETKESKEREERRKRFSATSGAKEEAPTSSFQLERSVTRKKLSLPRGVLFEDIVTQQGVEPVVEGTVYTHVFPHGFTEQTLIHLTDQSKHHITLVILPLVGRTDLYERYATADELSRK